MNIIKKYFTLKKIIIFLAVVFVVLFVVGNFSVALMDWQHYKAESISDKCSGIYIYDKDLYEEAKGYGDKIATLSNGFPIKRESLLIDTQYSRIKIVGRTIFFIDGNGNKHIIYQVRKYRQKYFAISIGGDEGRGLIFDIWRYYWLPISDNVFYIEDYNNLHKGICE